MFGPLNVPGSFCMVVTASAQGQATCEHTGMRQSGVSQGNLAASAPAVWGSSSKGREQA